MGSYFSFLERSGNYDFVLGDCYPVNIYGDIPFIYGDIPLKLSIMDLFPLSPNLMMLKINKGAENAPLCNNLKPYYKEPFFGNDNNYRYHLRKVYRNDVLYLNNLIIKNIKIGCVFKDDEKVVLETID